MTEKEIHETLNLLSGDMFDITLINEPCHVTEFQAHRKGDLITVRIMDSGPAAIHERYQVEAKSSDGMHTATGNAAASIEEALSIVHWNALPSVFSEE